MSTDSAGPRRILTALSLLAPVLVLSAVWFPNLAHDYVPRITVADDVIEAGRRLPGDELLEEVGSFTFGFSNFPDSRELVDAADKLLRGEVDVAGLHRTRITVPFSADDLDKGPGVWQLWLSSLTLPHLLLRAYQQTHDERYLFMARDMILGLARYERHAWLPKGLLWNDHAIATRIAALATFWHAYRRHPTYDPAVARVIFELLARSGRMLTDRTHFTAATNHGVMQNLGLLQLALTFPSLPEATRYKEIAFSRLQQQMTFYMNDEGFVLEHSPGYHRFGHHLVGRAIRWVALLGMTPPDTWVQKYERSANVLAQLQLPDRSMPAFGDTDAPLRPRRAAGGSPPGPIEPRSLYPVAGYSIWWDGLAGWPRTDDLSQTVVAWSYFPGHAHKHADEMSVWLWAGGRVWWQNIGYWPYHLPGRAEVESWSGSNAPHLVAEPDRSPRTARLAFSGSSAHLDALHVERLGPSRYHVARQVLYLRPNVWIVIDRARGEPTQVSRTQWTTSADTELSPGQAAGSYRLRPPAPTPRMSVHVLTSPGTTVRQLRGSSNPFAGWQLVYGEPQPAPALVVDQAAGDSWTMNIWCLGMESPIARPCPEGGVEGQVRADDDWTLSFAGRSAPLTLGRTGRVIRGTDENPSRGTWQLELQSPPDTSRERAELRRAFAEVTKQYPPFRTLPHYRLRVSLALGVLLVAQEILFALPTPIRRHYGLWRGLAVLAWAVLGFWITLVYLR